MKQLKFQILCSCIKCKAETTTGMLSRFHKNDCPELFRIRKRESKGKRVAWNKGLTKETDDRVLEYTKKITIIQREKVANGSFFIVPMGTEARKRLSEEQSLHNRGGKSKWFDVGGIKVQGTWERNLALKFNELGIKWTKPSTNNDVWKYIQDGIEKSYAPDFHLLDYNIWLEVKGYWWGRDKEKMEIVRKTYPDRKIIVIEKEDYKKILKNDLSPLN
jgi:hypothetical protein